FSRRRRNARHGSGGVAETLDKAKEDIRRGLLLLKAEKNGMGMDMDLLNMLDPTAPMQLRPSPASSRRRGSMTSSHSSGSNRSRFQSTMPTLEDVIGVRSPMSPMRQSFPFPPPSVTSATSWKESTSPQDQKVFFEAEQKATETLANAMKAMHRFSFPISASDSQQMSQQQQQNRLAAAIQQQKAAAVALPDSDAGSSFDTSSIHASSVHASSFHGGSHSLHSLHSLARSLTDPDTTKAIIGPFAAAAAAGSVAAGSTSGSGSGSNSLQSLQSLARSLTEPETNKAILGPFAAAAAAGSVAASGVSVPVPLPIPAPAPAAAEKANFDMMLNEVQSGIAMKEELVHQLEKAEAEYHHMRDQYEEEIRVMEDRIRDAEHDREREKSTLPGSVKVKYETKIKQLMAELSDLQHKYSEVSKVANEKRTLEGNQLRTLRVSVETLKAEKMRMIKRMKEDAERIKEMNAANDREIQALRRSEKAALEGRKKAEKEVEQHQQRANAMLHRNSNTTANNGASTQQAKVIGFLKKPQTPKGITKTAAKRPTRLNGPSDRKEAQASAIPAPTKAKSPGSIRLKVSQKKQVIDRAIYGYISGQHAINVMEDMLKKRERLKNEKQELEAERSRVVQAQEENAITKGGLLLDFASEPQYMDDRITMIDAEVAYINARIRALQAEAAALGFVTAVDKNHHYSDEETGLDGTRDEEELMTKLIRQGMAEDAMGLPPGSGASVAFESSVSIIRSMDPPESREFLEMLFEDMVTVRGHENGLQVQVSNQEKVIEELKRALQAMRQAAVGATLGYEKRCDGLEQKLRLLGGSSDHLNGAGRRAIGDGSSEDEEADAEVARLNRVAFQQQHQLGDSEEEIMKSPILSRQQSKDLLWTPVPEAATPRSGSAAEAAMDVKAKRASTIFDQLYEDAMKTSDEASPKVGGTGGEFSRILMANNEQRRVSWAGVPASLGLGDQATAQVSHHEQQQQSHNNNSQPAHHQLPPMPISRPGLARSSSTSAVNMRGVNHANGSGETTQQRSNLSMYGHRRSGSSSGGSAGGQGLGIGGLHRNASMSRLSNSAPNHHSNDSHFYQQQLAQQGQQLQQKGIYASTASSRQHAESIAARRSSTPISSPAIGPKSTARARNSAVYTSNAEAPLPSPTQHPRRGGTPLTIHTGFANGHPPQHTLRHAKSHQQPLNSQRLNHDARRASTPSPSPSGKRLSRSDSEGTALASQSANGGGHTRGHTTNGGNGRPLSRIGTANMMTTTATATNMMMNGLVSPGLNAFNGIASAGADGHFGQGGQHDVYHTHHHNGSAARRISGSWDDNQNVYERLASVHTQASQARLLATRNAVYTSTPAGGSMMTSGNMSSLGFHQMGGNSGRATPQMRMQHRPSVDGLSMAAINAAAAAHEQATNGGGARSGGEEGQNGERNNWSSTSSSSVTSASTTTSTLTAATNSPTLHESSSSSNGAGAGSDAHGAHHGGEGSSLRESLAKSEVGPVF
ncbi:hypothetical protein BGX24_010263, partial [Mortierella sp. AD032]